MGERVMHMALPAPEADDAYEVGLRRVCKSTF